MYDQSINGKSLSKTLRRSDFHRIFDLRDETLRNQIIERAVAIGNKGQWNSSPLKISKLRGKNVYSLPDFNDELLIRKVNNNIRHFRKVRNPARTSIITNLASIVAEAVPYRIYRLDVKSFFESFSIDHVLRKINDVDILSLATKRLLENLFKHFVDSGGSGIPRGLAISSTLSELMMMPFDLHMKNMKDVFFYARYVDDIIIVTSGNEVQQSFLRHIEILLPDGLKLSRTKQGITTVPRATKATTFNFPFEYLGYKFNVEDPGVLKTCRRVHLGIADKKLRKMKTKIILAIRDFCETKDMSILIDRLHFLCGNFSITDRDRGRKRLAGIFYNYHLINASNLNCGLAELDRFLRQAIISGHGPIFNQFKSLITSAERRRLSTFSFSRGFHARTFMHYTGSKLKLIQECWKYA